MRFHLLGSAQDAGVPHIGCDCDICTAARRDPARRRRGPSAAVVDEERGRAWLIDASPDLPEQLATVSDLLGPAVTAPVPLSAVLLTHIHLGHYWGLGHLGREGVMASGLMVLAPPLAATFLRRNRPFKDLIEWGSIDVRSVQPGDQLPLSEDLTAVPHRVPHREDFSDTVAWEIEGPEKRVLYAPDMDELAEDTLLLASEMDVLLVDGTFYWPDEVPGMSKHIPHPPVVGTIDQLAQLVEGGTRVVYTHLNHTNPLCDGGSKESGIVRSRGLEIAEDGMTIDI